MSSRRGRTLDLEYEHSPQIHHRRKSLFPNDVSTDPDTDLGCIAPLDFNSDNEEQSLNITKPDAISDYDILGVVDNRDLIGTPIHKNNYACSDTMSPLCLSPPINKNIINETPAKFSPTKNHKTPHDSTGKIKSLPKLMRKSILDESGGNKRKMSPTVSPVKKIIKIDPKVRTTLFPDEDNMSLPVKSFYSNETDNFVEKLIANRAKQGISSNYMNYNKVTHKTRKKSNKICNGVGHKIKKPKPKAQRNVNLVQTAKKLIGNDTAITEYIQDISEMKKPTNIQQKTIIEPPRLIRPALDEYNKENTVKNNDRKRSYESDDETLQNRKFFKHSPSKAVVNMTKSIKVSVDHGKMALLEKNNPKKPKITFDTSDFCDEPDTNTAIEINNLINDLESESPNKITLQAHNSILASENAIQLHYEPENLANIILSPISQMCDVTSGLALSSPKKARNLTSLLDSVASTSRGVNNDSFVDMEGSKLFPIFTSEARSSAKANGRVAGNGRLPTSARKFKKITADQMLLDAGQTKFGVTQCAECGFLYHIGDPGDEQMHQNYHDAGNACKFLGWKNEHIVADFNSNGRIIRILPTDSKIWIKKAKELMCVVNRDLGINELEFEIKDSQVFLYIKNKMIVGCAIAEPISEAHAMLASVPGQPDTCSEQKYSVKCGISRIWVHGMHRKSGIATTLMETVKRCFMPNVVLSNSDVAMSSPTDMGKEFAVKYFKTQNYLVYFPN